jgi:hypothetical protein
MPEPTSTGSAGVSPAVLKQQTCRQNAGATVVAAPNQARSGGKLQHVV